MISRPRQRPSTTSHLQLAEKSCKQVLQIKIHFVLHGLFLGVEAQIVVGVFSALQIRVVTVAASLVCLPLDALSLASVATVLSTWMQHLRKVLRKHFALSLPTLCLDCHITGPRHGLALKSQLRRLSAFSALLAASPRLLISAQGTFSPKSHGSFHRLTGMTSGL